MRVFLDVESYSPVDLRKCGAHRYFEHRDADILCVAYAFDDGVTHCWSPGQEPPRLRVRDDLFSSWNAPFERLAWRILHERYGWPELPPIEQWQCSMAIARQFGLPGGLDKAAAFLGVPMRKDHRGMALIRKWCIPNSNGERKTRESDPASFADLMNYCRQDVEVERAVTKALPRDAFLCGEHRVWSLDQRINDRGIMVDAAQATRIVAGASAWQAKLENEARRLTNGLIPSQRDAMLAWLRAQTGGEELDSLARDDMEEVLPKLEGEAKRVASIRLALARSSVAKFDAMLRTAGSDSRIRGMFVYHAGRTGRWAGTKVQPQNFPRVDFSEFAGMELIEQANALTLLGEDPMEVYSGLLRSTLIAAPGHKLVIGDLSQIELVKNAWLAGQQDVLDAFARGEDIYKLKAVEFFNLRSVDEVTKSLRQIAKSAVLGCGFGMGPARFQGYVQDMTGIELPDRDAERIVGAYRESMPAIRAFWYRLRDTMMTAVNMPGTIVPVNDKLAFFRKGEWLVLRLPSGRGVYFYKPRVVGEGWRANVVCHDPRFGDQRYWGGLLCENAVQASARDVLAHKMLEADSTGLRVVLHAHDEIVAEVESADSNCTARLKAVMEAPLPWAPGLPLRAEVNEGLRYRK